MSIIDDYIMQFDGEQKERLTAVRNTIRAAAPLASEIISYQMPAFYQNGNLVYFAAFKNHIGFFPTASGVAAFADRLGGFKTSKGTVQLPNSQPLPLELIAEIVKFKVQENTQKPRKK